MEWFTSKAQIISFALQVGLAIGWSTVLTVAVGVVQKLRSGELDWWVLGTLFAISLVLIMLERRAGVRGERQQPLLSSKGTQPVVGNEIIEPSHGSVVGREQTVTGKISIQVFVYSGDRKWYPQRSRTIQWSQGCTLGNVGTVGGSYRLVAVVGGHPLPTDMPVEDLPFGEAKTQEVEVSRR